MVLHSKCAKAALALLCVLAPLTSDAACESGGDPSRAEHGVRRCLGGNCGSSIETCVWTTSMQQPVAPGTLCFDGGLILDSDPDAPHPSCLSQRARRPDGSAKSSAVIRLSHATQLAPSVWSSLWLQVQTNTSKKKKQYATMDTSHLPTPVDQRIIKILSRRSTSPQFPTTSSFTILVLGVGWILLWCYDSAFRGPCGRDERVATTCF